MHLVLLLLSVAASSAADLTMETAMDALSQMKLNLDRSTDEDLLSSFLDTADTAADADSEAATEHEAMQSAVAKALHATMVEEGAHHSAEARGTFFNNLFNCNRCKLNTGAAGITLGKHLHDLGLYVGEDAEKLRRQIINTTLYAKAESSGMGTVNGKLVKRRGLVGHGHRDRVTEKVFVEALTELRTELETHEWPRGGLILSEPDEKYWKAASEQSFRAIFRSLATEKMAYRFVLRRERERGEEERRYRLHVVGRGSGEGRKCKLRGLDGRR